MVRSQHRRVGEHRCRKRYPRLVGLGGIYVDQRAVPVAQLVGQTRDASCLGARTAQARGTLLDDRHAEFAHVSDQIRRHRQAIERDEQRGRPTIPVEPGKNALDIDFHSAVGGRGVDEHDLTRTTTRTTTHGAASTTYAIPITGADCPMVWREHATSLTTSALATMPICSRPNIAEQSVEPIKQPTVSGD